MIVLEILLGLLLLVVVVVFAFAACGAGETIAWWTGRGSSRAPVHSPIVIPPRDPKKPIADQYIIYLSGVGRNSGEEVCFLDEPGGNLAQYPGAQGDPTRQFHFCSRIETKGTRFH